ncbi:hypothetical protein ILUMI_22316 [Ignelater luminosus]|uniref:RING-CH-type domain-containing protein n=1 Tax=Ignelater luminosus TaxID=2038154 RepID=A0A8K0CEL8_IGNLU|nr:hypothetical protein ILUMI_22316 [Ignelater luminosus]
MSDTQIRNKNNVIEQESSSSQQQEKKDIIVSIVLTESTTSLLQLDLPHLEDLDSENSQPSICAIKAETSLNEASYSGNHLNTTESGWINVCRICHGGESIGDLLSPCHCRGSIALAHLECLERWLKESANSKCELCQHHFQIIRQPRYSILKSIFVFLRHPGEHLSELLFDLFAFLIYTPAAVVSTYMLMLLCETATHSYSRYSQNMSAHFVAFASVIGMAAIDFTYSSWFMVNLQKHVIAWRNWYRNNCDVKLILPESKSTRPRRASSHDQQELD